MASDSLVNYFREKKTYRKKLIKAIARRDLTTVKALKQKKPKLEINHLIRERYSVFNDAIKDLDDPLTLLSLIAKFPAHRLFKVSPQQINLAKTLILMIKSYIVQNRVLRKVFLSVKGIYFQVEIMGNKITWLEPYPFVTTLPFDVDYKIMLSFTEFYQTLLKFVIFRFFSQKGLIYPPQINNSDESETRSFETTSTFQNCKIELRENTTSGEQNEEEDTILKTKKSAKVEELFNGFVFFLSSEVQHDLFEFIILSCGGAVVYTPDNFSSDLYKDTRITHVISDRKFEQIPKLPNREYVQPQWIADSLNNKFLLPTKDYEPGQFLPPHLSPFNDESKQSVVLSRQEEINKYKGEYVEENVEFSSEDDEVDEKQLEDEKANYKVVKDVYNAELEDNKKIKNIKKGEKEKEGLQKMMLTKKRQRLLERIENFDEDKKQKVKEIIKRKKEIKGKN